MTKGNYITYSLSTRHTPVPPPLSSLLENKTVANDRLLRPTVTDLLIPEAR